MSDLEKSLQNALEKIEAEGLARTLQPGGGVDFTSNDYLGFSTTERFRERLRAGLDEKILSAPASRLLRGTHPAHLELEKKLAEFKGAEAALIFPTGYQANLGLLTSLLGPQDRVLSDELNHASIIDGLRLSGALVALGDGLVLTPLRLELSHVGVGGQQGLTLRDQEVTGITIGDADDLAGVAYGVDISE